MEKFNLKEHLNKFIDGQYAINCKTEELADEFLRYCHKLGIKWCSGQDFEGLNEWNRHKKETCYWANEREMEYCSIDYYKNKQLIIIEFTGFGDTYDHMQKPKPPLGIIPKQIFEWHRVIELCKALHEYSLCEDVDQHLMIKWSDELNDRLYGLKGDI